MENKIGYIEKYPNIPMKKSLLCLLLGIELETLKEVIRLSNKKISLEKAVNIVWEEGQSLMSGGQLKIGEPKSDNDPMPVYQTETGKREFIIRVLNKINPKLSKKFKQDKKK